MTPNIDKIVEHYNHAQEKHPYFCDWVQSEKPQSYIKQGISNRLAACRECNKLLSEHGTLSWDDILDYETWKVFEALASGDNTQAVEELYNCVVVLLRTIDVLEGRQKLGKPDEVKEC